MKAPMDSPVLKEFVDFLDPINKLADESAGFIWRLKNKDGSAAANIESPLEDDMMLINISVWTDLEALKNFTYSTAHSYFVRAGRKWFEKMKIPYMALWWIDSNHISTIEEALSKLEYINRNGLTAEAFTFKKVFNSVGEEI